MTRPLEPRLLQAFVAVAHQANVSRAAETLFLSQPAVSLQLKELAQLTGLQLFKRTPNGVILTRDGAALLPFAERALKGLEDVAQAAQRFTGGARGTLRLGTVVDPEFTRLGAFLRELVSLAPEMQPVLEHGTSGAVLAKIVAGTLDGGYYLGEANEDVQRLAAGKRSLPALHVVPLTPFSYRVIGPPGWGPQVRGKDWRALVKLPWILTPPDSVHARLLASILGPLGLKQNRAALVDQEASMLALVRSGVGLSLARDALALRESQVEGVVVADRVAIHTMLSFVCLAAKTEDLSVAAALEALGRAWRGQGT